MKRFNIETGVGIFMLIGFLSFTWISIKLGNINIFGNDNLSPPLPDSTSVSGLKDGASIEIAGVSIGTVSSIYTRLRGFRGDCGAFDQEGHKAAGRQYRICPDGRDNRRQVHKHRLRGGWIDFIEPGGEIEDTESAINLEELVSKYIFESK